MTSPLSLSFTVRSRLPSRRGTRATLAAVFVMALADAGAADLEFRLHVVDREATYSACTAFDVDGDGRLDIVSGAWWYRAPSWTRQFIREVDFIRGRPDDYSNLPIDVNGDGRLDLISANYRSGTLRWIENPGESFGPWTTHLVARPGPMETARLVDVDGDGRLDVLPNGVRFAAWWELPRDGSGWIRHELPSEVAGHGVGFGDVDGDGRGDVVGPRGWLRAPVDRRAGTWTWHPEFDLGPDASIPIIVTDVDGDGDGDIVWGRGHRFGIYWLEQRRDAGDRVWTRHAIDTSISQFHSLLHADLDGDGQREVIGGKRWMGHEGRDPGEYDPLIICRYEFDGSTRTWRRDIISRGGVAGFGLDPEVVDLDADGDLDLICPGRSGLCWLENLGARTDHAGDGEARPGSDDVLVAGSPYADHSRLLVRRELGDELPVETPVDWALRREDILAGAQLAMGPLPGPERRCPLDVEYGERVVVDGYTRWRISYGAEPGDRVPAYLLVPERIRGRAPAMLCLHQTVRIGKDEPVGLGNRPTLQYADELARRGYVCLAPDYPSFGEYDFDFAAARDRHASGTMKAIWNNMRAVDLLESLPEVDPDRIGCIGHSLGGHNAIFTAVFDQRLRAIISSCGFTAFHHYYDGRLAGWTSDRYMPRIRDLWKNDPDRVPFDFHELIAALAPRGFFSNSPLHDHNFDVTGVRKVEASARRVYELLGAPQRLRIVYPDAKHDFPDGVRRMAYEWLDGEMGKRR